MSKVWVIFLRHLAAIRFARSVVLGVDVEALCIAGISYRGLNGALLSTVENVIPVGVKEERVGFHTCCTAAYITKAPRTIDGAEGPYYILSFF